MKLVSVSLFIILLATQAFSKWVILLEFEWNKEYIAANLCENRAKPIMKCGGKCQLAKKMTQSENDPSSSVPPKAKFQEVLFAFQSTDSIKPKLLNLSQSTAGMYSSPLLPFPSFPIFHPPA